MENLSSLHLPHAKLFYSITNLFKRGLITQSEKFELKGNIHFVLFMRK
jgi:hypothetical protein